MDEGSKTFKQRREEERKASEATGDTRAWNCLFMRPDTVCSFCIMVVIIFMFFYIKS